MAARKNINVTRNDRIINMSVYELLVGDLVQIETGEIISVDGIVCKSNRLTIDESALTGEPDALRKEPY